jgi:hypothetical protein
VAAGSGPLIVEAACGRAMTLLAGDVFLGTPGHRTSLRMVGGVPKRGLIPGKTYWLLAESGIVGDLVGGTPNTRSFAGQVKYLGAVARDDGKIVAIGQFTATSARRPADHGAPVFLIVGTSPEVGKTTAGVAVLRTLVAKGHASVIALKATGTSCVTEVTTYRDYGATQVFDCVDFGLPATHPSNRKGMSRVFDRMLDTCLCVPADAVLIECGGDILGGNVPMFLRRLRRRRSRSKVILAAADALGALSATRVLRDAGLPVDLITGPCTDTHTAQQRTKGLCKTDAMNLSHGPHLGLGALTR